MKKLIAATGAVLVAFLLVTATLTPPRTQEGEGDTASPTQNAGEIYIIRSENDRVVVYLDGAVYLRTDTLVSSLPKSDRVRLSEGITVFSKEELKKLVEDYCS